MNVITAITTAWGDIMEALVSLFGPAEALFWNAESGLTFLGGLSIVGVSISVVLLVVHIIQNFLHLKG